MNLLTIGGFLLKEAKVFHSQKHPWAWSTGWASCWLTWEGNVSFATISTIKHLSNNQHFNSHMFIIFALSNHLSQQAMAQVSNSPRNFLISDSGVFGPTLKDNNCVWVTDKGQQKQTILRFFKLTLSLTSSWHCSTHLHMSLYTWKGKTDKYSKWINLESDSWTCCNSCWTACWARWVGSWHLSIHLYRVVSRNVQKISRPGRNNQTVVYRFQNIEDLWTSSTLANASSQQLAAQRCIFLSSPLK